MAYVQESSIGFGPNQRRRPLELPRSEEHTSELQSPYDLVCRLLLEKKQDIGEAPVLTGPLCMLTLPGLVVPCRASSRADHRLDALAPGLDERALAGPALDEREARLR